MTVERDYRPGDEPPIDLDECEAPEVSDRPRYDRAREERARRVLLLRLAGVLLLALAAALAWGGACGRLREVREQERLEREREVSRKEPVRKLRGR